MQSPPESGPRRLGSIHQLRQQREAESSSDIDHPNLRTSYRQRSKKQALQELFCISKLKWPSRRFQLALLRPAQILTPRFEGSIVRRDAGAHDQWPFVSPLWVIGGYGRRQNPCPLCLR
jgi:hypothetical protein